jgi:putative transcriptional regulator
MTTQQTLTAPTSIHWRMAELMARKRITNRDLSKAIGLHETSISRLKSAETMPRLDGEQLSLLCWGLGCTPAELLEYVQAPAKTDLQVG